MPIPHIDWAALSDHELKCLRNTADSKLRERSKRPVGGKHNPSGSWERTERCCTCEEPRPPAPGAAPWRLGGQGRLCAPCEWAVRTLKFRGQQLSEQQRFEVKDKRSSWPGWSGQSTARGSAARGS